MTTAFGGGFLSFNKPVDDVKISGIANGTVNNVPVSGLITNGVHGVLISGLIKDVVNNIPISGMASGIVNNVPASGMASGIIDEVIISDIISGIVNNIQISGLITGYVNNVNIQGKISGILNDVRISGLVNGIAEDAVFSDYIDGTVYGQINVKSSDVIKDVFINDTIVNNFKTILNNSISSSTGTNEENYFGSTVAQIRPMVSGAINDIIDYNSFHNIIIPTYLSKNSISDLTDKILFGVMITNGTYISGDFKAEGDIEISGSIEIKGSSIDSFKNTISTKIKDATISILSNITINEIIYDIVDSYEISGLISGFVSGSISGMISNPISELAYGYASGYATGSINGVVQNDVIRSISSTISGKAFGSVSGIGYGMASTIAYAPGVGNVTVDKIVLNSFLDDSFSDFTNLYELSSSEGSSSLDGLNNAINPGGRGQLSKYFIINPDFESSGFYDVGSYIDNTNSKFRNELLNFEASSGYITENPPYNDYFGGMGGNVIQNSFDFYEKNIPEKGFVKIMYVSPSI